MLEYEENYILRWGIDMKTNTLKKVIWLLLCIMGLLIISACSSSQTGISQKSTPTPTEKPPQELFYDYESIYTYHNIAYDREKFQALAELLQSKDILTVEGTNYMEDSGILQINYQLNLTKEEPDYTVDFTKQMQDAVVLFAAFDYIKGVEFNFKQANYGFGGVPIMRADAETIFGEPIAPFGNTKADFTEKFPSKVQSIVWQRNVMDTVNYYHAMGLDE